MVSDGVACENCLSRGDRVVHLTTLRYRSRQFITIR